MTVHVPASKRTQVRQNLEAALEKIHEHWAKGDGKESPESPECCLVTAFDGYLPWPSELWRSRDYLDSYLYELVGWGRFSFLWNDDPDTTKDDVEGLFVAAIMELS
jgi:hypothetical protein